MEQPVVAVYDANVLYSAPLRDLLVRLAHAGIVQAKWTEHIHLEWMRSVLKGRPDLLPERLARTRALMDQAVRDCLVTEYEGLIETLALPDPNDRHVLAAAIKAGASVIVTGNLKDFPDEVLNEHGVEAEHPDDFLCQLLADGPAAVITTVQRQREALRSPPKSADELLTMFSNLGLLQFVANLRPFVDQL